MFSEKKDRNPIGRIWGGLLLGLLLLTLGRAREMRAHKMCAQASDNFPEMTVTLAWEDHLRIPGWTEVRVALRNEVGDWEGALLMVDPRREVTYRRAVQLPARSYKQYRIPLYIEDGLDYEVVLQGVERSEKSKLSLTRPNSRGRVCVVASERDLAAYALEACEARIWIQDLAQLPETAQVWDTVDLLLLNGMATSVLTDQQRAALVSWVGMGGHIIVGGGASLPRALDGLPATLRIATTPEIHLMDATILGKPGGNGAEGRIAVAALALRDTASSILTEGDMIIAARERLGSGLIDFVGWDLAEAAGQAWTATLWEGDHAPAVYLPFASTVASSGPSPGPSSGIAAILQPQPRQLLQVPASAVPRLGQWFLLFPLYLLLMGPGTLWIVRRVQRPILAWVLLPVWIGASLLLLSSALSGAFSRTFPLLHERATIYVSAPDLPARAFQGSALYAPRVGEMSWRAAGMPRPLFGGYRFDSWYGSGEPFPVEVRAVGQAESAIVVPRSLGIVTWGAEGEVSPPQIRADLRLDTRDNAPRVIGEIQSEIAFKKVKLLFYNDQLMHHLPLTTTVAPETTVRVSRPVTDIISQGRGGETAFCEDLSYGGGYYMPPFMYSGPGAQEIQTSLSCYLAVKTDGVPFPAQDIKGAQVSESCWLIHVPCPQQSAGSLRISLAPDRSSVEGGWWQEENVLSLDAPITEARFVMPPYLQISRAASLTITFAPPPWRSPPGGPSSSPMMEIESIAIWDWDQEAWASHPPPAAGSALHFEGRVAASYFDPQEGVRLQLQPHLGEHVVVQIEITLQGSW